MGCRLRNRPIENEYAAAMYKHHIRQNIKGLYRGNGISSLLERAALNLAICTHYTVVWSTTLNALVDKTCHNCVTCGAHSTASET